MPVYQCRFLDRAGNPVMTRVASEHDGEAVEMARNVSKISGTGSFELWQNERCVYPGSSDSRDRYGRANTE